VDQAHFFHELLSDWFYTKSKIFFLPF
jgi:hypothetical protein